MKKEIVCSFCQVKEGEADFMIQSPDKKATICGKCVEKCRDWIGAHRHDAQVRANLEREKENATQS